MKAQVSPKKLPGTKRLQQCSWTSAQRKQQAFSLNEWRGGSAGVLPSEAASSANPEATGHEVRALGMAAAGCQCPTLQNGWCLGEKRRAGTKLNLKTAGKYHENVMTLASPRYGLLVPQLFSKCFLVTTVNDFREHIGGLSSNICPEKFCRR